MKQLSRLFVSTTIGLAAALFATGCASTGDGSSGAASSPHRFRTHDGRNVDIGRSRPADGGMRYDNPHMEKGKVWVADNFNFTGYDTLYIVPTESTAQFPDKEEDTMVHNLARERLVMELAAEINRRDLFPNVVTEESAIPPNARVLRLANTITEFNRGGGAARYFAGLYGGGQPVLRVQGTASEGGKPLFNYEARRSGTSAGARMGGVFMKDEDIQSEDIRSLALDLADFMAAVAGKYPPR